MYKISIFFQVIASILASVSFFLLIGAVSSANWVSSDGWKEGLFEQCVDKGAPLPLPFGLVAEEGCIPVRGAGYIKVVTSLMIIGILTDFFGAILTGLGLISTDPNKKRNYYRIAIYSLIVTGLYLNLTFLSISSKISKLDF